MSAQGGEPETDARDFSAMAAERTSLTALARRELAPITAPQQYQMQFSTTEEHVRLVERAKALLARSSPCVSLGELHQQALQLLVEKLEKMRFAVTDRPRKVKCSMPREETLPASRRRDVAATSRATSRPRRRVNDAAGPLEAPRQRGVAVVDAGTEPPERAGDASVAEPGVAPRQRGGDVSDAELGAAPCQRGRHVPCRGETRGLCSRRGVLRLRRCAWRALRREALLGAASSDAVRPRWRARRLQSGATLRSSQRAGGGGGFRSERGRAAPHGGGA